GFLYVGPASDIHTGHGLTFVAPSDAPEALSEWTQAQAQRLVAYYAERLGRQPASSPTVMLSFKRASVPDFAGDVTPHGMMLLQIAAASAEAAAAQGPDAFHLLAHEFFHLWNYHIDDPSGGDNALWIHEGSADYAAALATRALHPELDYLDLAITQN